MSANKRTKSIRDKDGRGTGRRDSNRKSIDNVDKNGKPIKFNSFGEPLYVQDDGLHQSDAESGGQTPKKQFVQYKDIIKQHKQRPTSTGRQRKEINPIDVNQRQSSYILELNRQNKMHRSKSPNSQPGFYVHPSHRGTDYLRKKAQKKIKRTRIDGTVASGPLFIPYGAPGVEEQLIEQYQNNQRDMMYIQGTGQRNDPQSSALKSTPYPDGNHGFNVGYYSNDDVVGGVQGDSATPVGAFMSGANIGQRDDRAQSVIDDRRGGTAAGDESSYDEAGNPMVGGKHDRNGQMKQKYILVDMQGNTEVNMEESSCYDSDGNPAPITIGVKVNRKVYKYDSQGRPKKPKAKRDIRIKKTVGIGAKRSRANIIRGQSGYETGSASTLTKQKSLLDYYKMAEVDIGSHGQELCSERENSWILKDPWSDDDDDPNIVRNLSYRKVKDNQYFKHPHNRKTKEKFDWWSADLKYFPLCCSKLQKSNEWVTPCAKEIGIGPTMFLLTNKAFAYLFLFFFILNLPLMVFYTKGGNPPEVPKQRIDVTGNEGDANGTDETLNSTQSSQFTEMLSWLSLGNLGTSGYTCANFNFARHNNTFIFNCNYGTMRLFTAFGIQKTDNQTCETAPDIFIGENNAITDLQYDCDFERGLRPEGKKGIMKQFDELCKDQSYCELPIKYSWFNLQCRDRLDYYSAASRYPDYAFYREWMHFYQRDGRIREPVIFGVALCIADKLYNPLNGEQVGFTKSEFSYVLIIFDAIVVLTTIWFINFLAVRMRQYRDEFDKQQVQMTDFTIKISNLAYDIEYGGKESLILCSLWGHVENVVKNRMLQKAEGDQETQMRIEEDRFWEIADINFIKHDTRETELLYEMDELEREKCRKIKTAQVAAEKGQDISSQTQPIVELIKQYKQKKAEFIHIQEDKLYKRWVCPDGQESVCTIPEAYITFRSMRGAQVAREVLTDTVKRHKATGSYDEYFYGRPLIIEECVKCESLIWAHLPYSQCNRYCRITCVNILAVIVILLSFMAMIIFSNWEAELKAGAGTETKCPDKPVDAEIAYFDWDKPVRQRQGFMHCYCVNIYNQNNGDISSSLEVFQQWNSTLNAETNPCEEWLYIYERQMWIIILAGALIAIINAICVLLFELIVCFEKYRTYEEQTIAQYTRITIIQVLNIAFILLVAEFNLGRPGIGWSLPMFEGKYKDFDTGWYQDVGVKITIVMISQSFGTFGGRLFEPIVKIALRLWDRYKGRCKYHLRKKTNDDIEAREAEEEAIKNGSKKKEEQKPEEEEEDYGEEQDEEGAEGGQREMTKDQIQENLKRLQNLNDEIGPDPNERIPIVKDGKLFSHRILDTYASKIRKKSKKTKIKQTNKSKEIELAKLDSSRNMLEGGEENEEEVSPGGEEDGEQDEHDPQNNEDQNVDPDEPQTEIIFQDDLNELYMGNLAKVFFIYAALFTNLLVYYMYGGGIPILWGFGAIFFCLAYIAYKFMFVWFHQITYGFDHYIPILSISMIKWALLLHISMVLFMYTDRRLLTPPNYTEEMHYRPPAEDTGIFFERRFRESTNFSVLLYVVIMFILYFIYRCLIIPIMYCISWNKKASLDYDAEVDRLDHSDDIYKELQIHWLRNLYVRANKEWEIFRTMLNSISYDQEKLTDDAALIFKQKLRNRITNIEETIDIHLNSMGGLENNTDKTYIYKLAILSANEEKIKQKDPTCQRMVDMIQSYYIYASIDYTKINLILKRIDRELMELSYQTKEQPVYC